MTADKSVNDEPSDPRDRLTSPFVETAIRLAALGLLAYWAFVLLSPFITIVIWSIVLTVALYPVYEWMVLRLGGRRRLAAVLITILSLLFVIGPTTWLALGLIDSLRTLSEHVDLTTLALPPPRTAVKEWPLIGEPIYQFWQLASTNIRAALAKIIPELKPLGASVLGIAADAGTGILKFFLSIIVAGFLFSPAPSLVAAAKQFSHRLISQRGEEFVELAGATIRTVSRGVIGVSVLQALLAGIGMIAAGIPAASLLTSAALIFAIIQIGAWIVLVPVVIWSWWAMDMAPALMFTVYMVPVNLLDNILRPFVMARGLETPMLVILIGVVGGTLAYGIIGLFLGPIALAVIWELLVAWVYERE